MSQHKSFQAVPILTDRGVPLSSALGGFPPPPCRLRRASGLGLCEFLSVTLPHHKNTLQYQSKSDDNLSVEISHLNFREIEIGGL